MGILSAEIMDRTAGLIILALSAVIFCVLSAFVVLLTVSLLVRI